MIFSPCVLKAAGLNFYIDSRVQVLHNEEDRINLDNWLDNQQRRAETRRVAVDLGYTELAIRYSLVKKVALRVINFTYSLWRVGLNLFYSESRFRFFIRTRYFSISSGQNF
jgi:hypothetical protein